MIRRIKPKPVRSPALRFKPKPEAEVASEAYRSLFENGPIPMWAYDRETLRFLVVNNAAVEQYGYSRSEFLQMTLKDLRPVEEVPRLLEFIQQREYPEKTWGEWTHRKKDGTLVDVEVYGTKVVIGGRPADVAILHDVTEQRKLQAAITKESAQLRLVMSQLPAYVWTTDRTPVYTSYEGSGAPLFDYALTDMVGRSVLVTANEKCQSEEVLRRYRAVLSGRTMRYEYVTNSKTFECQLQPLRDGSGKVTGTIGVAIEVTERKRMDDALNRQEAVIAASEQLAHLGSWEYYPATDVAIWSKELYEIMDHPRSDNGLKGASFWEHVHPDDLYAVQRAFAQSVANCSIFRIEHRIVRQDGSVRWLHSTGEPLCDAEGKLLRIFGSALDVTERKQAEDRLEYILLHDPLTELPNRLSAERFIELTIVDATHRNRSLAVLTVNIDRFKTINDGLGHAAGDQLLIAMPERLRACIRAGDLIARLSGDTFIVVLSDVEDESEAADFADRILHRASDPLVIAGQKLTVTVSVGVSLCPRDGASASVLIEGAEAAMFRAKELGRNRVQSCGADQQALAVERLSLEQDLRLALERKEFALWYQPIVSFKTGTIIAAEALLRWQHPKRGLVQPGGFIPLAEETGLIIPIGDRALYSACCQVASWRAQGFENLYVTVNVSKVQLRNRHIVESVRRVLDVTGVEPSALMLEITEGGIMSDPNAADTLEALKSIGVGLSIDDFGTGYSSLAYLKRFPIDTLKIDRAFIKDLTTDPSDAAIATSIVTLGHSLHMTVVAEGVETLEQLTLVRDMGCDAMQGFFYGRPMRVDDFTALLTTDRRISVVAPA
jgi:diguanylate cyclase (GGDEF)-like protein/PAS domain S-box-containing protein